MVIPLTEGLPEFESVVEEEEFVALGAEKEELSDEYFTDSSIESRAGIEENSKDWFVVVVDRVMNDFREKEGSHFMAHARAKELNISSGVVPVLKGELPDVGVQALRSEGAGTDSSVTRCLIFVLLMPFIKNTGMSSVNFINSCIFNVL